MGRKYGKCKRPSFPTSYHTRWPDIHISETYKPERLTIIVRRTIVRRFPSITTMLLVSTC
jgi:hypothetical protein